MAWYYTEPRPGRRPLDTPVRSGGGGEPGPEGPPGPAGPAGPGVAAGGTAGQVLTKDTAIDYDTSWQTPTGNGGGGAAVHIGADAPATPAAGQFWWRTDPDGTLFIYYDDGTSAQFVPATPAVAGPAGATGPQGPPITVTEGYQPPPDPLPRYRGFALLPRRRQPR
jgi:hypothetical protein